MLREKPPLFTKHYKFQSSGQKSVKQSQRPCATGRSRVEVTQPCQWVFVHVQVAHSRARDVPESHLSEKGPSQRLPGRKSSVHPNGHTMSNKQGWGACHTRNLYSSLQNDISPSFTQKGPSFPASEPAPSQEKGPPPLSLTHCLDELLQARAGGVPQRRLKQ